MAGAKDVPESVAANRRAVAGAVQAEDGDATTQLADPSSGDRSQEECAAEEDGFCIG